MGGSGSDSTLASKERHRPHAVRDHAGEKYQFCSIATYRLVKSAASVITLLNLKGIYPPYTAFFKELQLLGSA